MRALCLAAIVSVLSGASAVPQGTRTYAGVSSTAQSPPKITAAVSGTTTTTSPVRINTGSSTLADCLNGKSVPVLFASSADYATFASPYNLRLPYKPAVIVIPTTNKHVSDAILCAGLFNIKIQARSGGHSYASYNLGGKDGSMVVDLRNFQTINVDQTTGIATVGGGVRLGNLATGLYNQGKRALPHGTCPGVGIGGHFTHGGYGFDSRAWGLALDTIVSMDVVVADGSVRTATATQNSDLFWALRGAADSFGIITQFKLQTQRASDSVVWFSYDLSNILTSGTVAADAFLHVQSFARNASVVDRQIGFNIYTQGSVLTLTGTYFGTKDKFQSQIELELLRGLPSPKSTAVEILGWLQMQERLTGNGASLPQPVNYNAHMKFFAKSLETPESAPLTREALIQYFNFITSQKDSTGSPWFSIIDLFGGADSQINNKDTSFSSYAHRNSLWVFQHYGYVSDVNAPFPQSITNFITNMNNVLVNAMPTTKFLAYPNYVDPTLTAQQAHDLYYGSTVYSRLTTLKTQYDPKRLFWNPQAIGT